MMNYFWAQTGYKDNKIIEKNQMHLIDRRKDSEM